MEIYNILHDGCGKSELFDKIINDLSEKRKSINIVYLEDTDENRESMMRCFGFCKCFFSEYTYIEFNLENKIWHITPAFQWMYRNSPKTFTFNELLDILKLEKINTILHE